MKFVVFLMGLVGVVIGLLMLMFCLIVIVVVFVKVDVLCEIVLVWEDSGYFLMVVEVNDELVWFLVDIGVDVVVLMVEDVKWVYVFFDIVKFEDVGCGVSGMVWG